ncbi:hypothetical protein CHS0354_022568 [Potamilus streckersoni]|uniref:Uncharacterized protein n=1 Tax=Potamilus streckersoni TaxID=2493646 RepID=A0AAE0SI23_9BIVA|nr:hypothetical protein CHS0354_022568 [Potamilus streckersoni]
MVYVVAIEMTNCMSSLHKHDYHMIGLHRYDCVYVIQCIKVAGAAVAVVSEECYQYPAIEKDASYYDGFCVITHRSLTKGWDEYGGVWLWKYDRSGVPGGVKYAAQIVGT